MADALTGKFDTIFGVLLILALFLEEGLPFYYRRRTPQFCLLGLHLRDRWGNFWVKIGLSVTIICIYSLIWQRPNVRFNGRNIFTGILSAALLYGLFTLGEPPGAVHHHGGRHAGQRDL